MASAVLTPTTSTSSFCVSSLTLSSSFSSTTRSQTVWSFSGSVISVAPQNSNFEFSKSAPQLGLCQLTEWNGLKSLGISTSQHPVKLKLEIKGQRKGKGVYASLFGVGAPEALVIGVVALLVFGPKGLAENMTIAVVSTAIRRRIYGGNTPINISYSYHPQWNLISEISSKCLHNLLLSEERIHRNNESPLISTHLRLPNVREFLYSTLFLLLVAGYLVRTHLLFVSRVFSELQTEFEKVARNLGKTLRAFQPTIRELQEVSREFKSTLEKEIGIDDIKNSNRNTFNSSSTTSSPPLDAGSRDSPPNIDPNGSPSPGKAYSSEELLKITEEQLNAAAVKQLDDSASPVDNQAEVGSPAQQRVDEFSGEIQTDVQTQPQDGPQKAASATPERDT